MNIITQLRRHIPPDGWIRIEVYPHCADVAVWWRRECEVMVTRKTLDEALKACIKKLKK